MKTREETMERIRTLATAWSRTGNDSFLDKIIILEWVIGDVSEKEKEEIQKLLME